MNRLRLLSACLVVAILTASCASGRSAEMGASTTAKAAAPVTLPGVFTGSVADFYVPPSPLPAGKPGQLIRIQTVTGSTGVITVRVMYHSIDADHCDQPTTGIVSYPTAPAPAGGWPVTSTAPGTVGLHTTCALSRMDNPAPDYGISGVHVQTDYIGMVAGQRQRYLSGVSEAHSVIDAVRAARNIPAAHVGSRWVAVGQSQGGHSALTTEPAVAIVAQNDPGNVKAGSPLLLGYGTKDIYVVPARALALYARLCMVGQITQLWKLDGADHGNEMSRGAPQIHDWIAARFAGKPPVNSCAK